MKAYNRYYAAVLIGVWLCAAYPIYMGFTVICEMATYGTVFEEVFPKYIIPYTPIAIAVIVTTAMMPLHAKSSPFAAVTSASITGIAVFLAAEWYFESQVIVTSTVTSTLESWQMYMCYVPPSGTYTRTWTAVDVLMGEYSPTFKLHFYLISAVLIIAVIRVIYGFGHMLYTKETAARRALIVQSVCTALFLGLCILACFTAFFRDGELTVSPLSAVLMALFFIVLGVTAGLFVASLLLGKTRWVSVGIPAAVAIGVTLAMYIGETFLLSGHLYRFGEGVLFSPIGDMPFAPVDVVIILAAGGITALVSWRIQPQSGDIR